MERDPDRVFACPGKIGQRLAVPDTLAVDEIEALSRALDESALGQDFGDAAVAGVLLPQQVFLIDARGESARAHDFDPPGILPHEDGAAVAVVTVTHGVQHGFPHRALVKGGTSQTNSPC